MYSKLYENMYVINKADQNFYTVTAHSVLVHMWNYYYRPIFFFCYFEI